ncbi:hypothetical protein PPERSA_12462 [Pseudocohnilembus persalinus]|uniref:SGNH hydrolase-type esterase domain-containing protein n=1 Tax=Pseudocohnilembus persalinus TaxID=266149 RepID=A0A0V0QNV5_PSEPJ|nr:hypothetical protein PPERSA_12462 [Pseudocohnilembus persalinus]|eukprot:KRX04015.1 hypothetical protein PPERSA_12462 [Pseudocohnilembus persalinus]
MLKGILSLILINIIDSYINHKLKNSHDKYFKYITLKRYLSFIIFPLLILEGLYINKKIPRLGVPADETKGLIKNSNSENPSENKLFKILYIGESTIAGVGLNSHQEGLSRQTALKLVQRKDFKGIDIEYDSIGQNGANIKYLLEKILPRFDAKNFDTVIIAIGVNDIIEQTNLKTLKKQLLEVIQKIKQQNNDIKIHISSPPPMDKFKALPQPLRSFLGYRAIQISHIYRSISKQQENVFYSLAEFEYDRKFFAPDHFHPSSHGNFQWAEIMAQSIEPVIIHKD